MEPAQDKVVFITGASSGFGLLTSVRLAEQGYQVVASMRDTRRSDKLMELAAAVGVANRINIVELDVANEEQADAVIQETLERLGRIDVLINNAGIGGHGFVEEVPSEEWRKTFNVNFFGALACIRSVLPHLRNRHSGIIINVGSVGGRIASPGAGPYSASKFALEALSESLRLEMAAFGVKVAIVEPGAFKTDMWSKADDYLFAKENSPYATGVEAIRKWVEAEKANSSDPIEVAELICNIIATGAPTLRYPVGTMANQPIGDFIRGYLSTPWEQIENSRLG